MCYTERFTEVHYPLTWEDPDIRAVGVHTTGYVSLMNYHRAVVYIHLGAMTATSTFDVRVLQATDVLGTGAKALTPAKAITQITQAAGGGDDLIALEIRTEELDVSNRFDCIAVEVTIGAATAYYSLVVFGLEPRYAPTGVTNWAQVIP